MNTPLPSDDDQPLHHEDFAILLRHKLEAMEATMRALVEPQHVAAPLRIIRRRRVLLPE